MSFMFQNPPIGLFKVSQKKLGLTSDLLVCLFVYVCVCVCVCLCVRVYQTDIVVCVAIANVTC